MAGKQDPVVEPEAAQPPAKPQEVGLRRKNLLWIGGITAAVWAFAIYTGSLVFMIIVGVLTLALIFVLFRAFRSVGQQRELVNLLHGASASPEARHKAVAQLADSKDANTPFHLFARAQLIAADDPKAALDLLVPVDLKTFPPAMQDDVSLLKTQLYLVLGRTADARKTADSINLENPSRKDSRPLAATIVGEAWARTGKAKEALALLDSIEIPRKDGDQILMQARVARIFARFAANQRAQCKNDLTALADDNIDHLGRFLLPQFRVHPELQKIARRVFDQHPSRRTRMKVQKR
ncbi:MAG: hypothetical protein H6Q90_300 [Deltaproteobacteria bacterium]|nr:hypothetical protein [Deltaproteobacteria bacterium]